MARIVAWLSEGLPSILWTIVRWVTFFFKLASLAFIIPILGLIIFDFCVWLWRLYRPSSPADSPQPSRVPNGYVQPPSTDSTKASTTVIELETASQATERRARYGAVTDNR
ncbi:hypothetical protein F4859DRAFT_144877 [Xylaria cf. heliscus]|nr:hypothetical protein F4859DRAFT_144877 [Xylaria cf. heliscus]